MEFDLNVPGAFIEHSPLRPALSRTTALSHSSSRSVYHTPKSPSAATSLSRSVRAARPGSELGAYTGSRKRQRIDATIATPDSRGYFSHSNYDMLNTPTEAQSPKPLVNTDYRLAGGMDTPQPLTEDERDFDLDCRMNRFNIASREPTDPRTPAPLSRDGQGRKREHNDSPKDEGWDIPRTVWALTGNIALKAVSFAWNTGRSFTGFRAGGGQKYTYPGFEDQSWMAVDDEKEDPFDEAWKGRRERNGTPIPGDFPDDERFIEDYMEDPSAHQQRGNGSLETPTLYGYPGSTSTLRSKTSESWVLIPQGGRSPSPTRRHKKPNGTLNPTCRPASRASLAPTSTRPRLQPRTSTSNASYASPRASPRGSAYSHSTRPTLQPLEDTTNTSLGHRRSRSSIASPRRSSTIPSTLPMSPEIQNFKHQARRKEKKMDNSMRRLNSQLQEMIREGKEALGTRVEVRDISLGSAEGGYEVDQVESLEVGGEEDEGYAGSESLSLGY